MHFSPARTKVHLTVTARMEARIILKTPALTPLVVVVCSTTIDPLKMVQVPSSITKFVRESSKIAKPRRLNEMFAYFQSLF